MSMLPEEVLLVEDNPGDVDLVRLRLVEGFPNVSVDCVGRLSDGLERLAKKRPSVVLLDLSLPDSQGADPYRRVLEKAPGVPVVILSGQSDESLAVKALNQGAQDYIAKKDMTSAGLARAMRYAIERQGLLRSIEMARKQQLEFKNQFLSHVSHELRTPITCIHQYTALLLDGLAGALAPEQRDHLGTILRSVNQLSTMVRDLLEASRAEMGKLKIEPHCVLIPELAGQALAMMKETARLKEVTLVSEIEDGLPFIVADPGRVLGILINLLDNAIKFTPPAGKVTLQASRSNGDPDFVYFAVQDTGCGISPEARPLIFERLYQDPQSVDSNRKGLGLGLFITKELVSLHGGRIWLASEAGPGSTFAFTLPVYSLPKLLAPVIWHQGKLRDSIVLLRMDLKPRSTPVLGNWKDVCVRSLELLQRCVYLDKDLVLPPMPSAGPEQTFFVVASTDVAKVEIMSRRIREVMEKAFDWKGAGSFAITARPIDLPGGESQREQKVTEVAERITSMVREALGTEKKSARKQGASAS